MSVVQVCVQIVESTIKSHSSLRLYYKRTKRKEQIDRSLLNMKNDQDMTKTSKKARNKTSKQSYNQNIEVKLETKLEDIKSGTGLCTILLILFAVMCIK